MPDCGHQGQQTEPVEHAQLCRLDVIFSVELSGRAEWGAQTSGERDVQPMHARTASAGALVDLIGAAAERRNHADSGDHDPSRGAGSAELVSEADTVISELPPGTCDAMTFSM